MLIHNLNKYNHNNFIQKILEEIEKHNKINKVKVVLDKDPSLIVEV